MEKEHRLRHVYNEANESCMATVLRHFNVAIYQLLLVKKMKFCGVFKELLKNLPIKTRQIIAGKNKNYFTPCEVTTDDHPLMSKCWLSVDHFQKTLYSDRIRNFIKELDKHPTKQLLELAVKCSGLKVVFDFKNENISMMDPSWSKNYLGCFYYSGIILIGAKRMDRQVHGTFAHELGHFAMYMIYDNGASPFRFGALHRQQEFTEIIDECRAIEEKKEDLGPFRCVFQTYSVLQIFTKHVEAFERNLEIIKSKYSKLFAFYHKYIVPDIDRFLREDPRN